MLQEIYIRNFVLIDELRLELGAGLNVLTGETGAGKSIIMDALGLVAGDRIRNDLIRDPEKRALVEAVFLIEENAGVWAFLRANELFDEGEDSLVITREIIPGGRSLARVNGRSLSLNQLRELAAILLDMHLQHEYLSILNRAKYLDYVDSFVADDAGVLQQLATCFVAWDEKSNLLTQLKEQESHKLQQMDFLQYQIKEIEAAGLDAAEESELMSLKQRIRNAQKLVEGAQKLLQVIHRNEQGASASDLLGEALEICRGLHDDEAFAAMQAPLEDIYYRLEEMASALASFRNGLDFEPGQLEQVEQRLYEISRLKAKYGIDIEAILVHADQARQELKFLTSSQERQEELEAEIRNLAKQYLELAGQLSDLRQAAARCLQERVHHELLDLNLPQIQFEVMLEATAKWTPMGLDRVDFIFSANPGQPLRSLDKVASGGEISRFVLALKTALAEIYRVPTLIFDEIDVGVGGTGLTSMARKLDNLSHSHQVILVTHAPQVAAYADTHYQIDKTVVEGRTSTSVKQLNVEERVQELARMLAGDNYSEVTLQHAREMLDQHQA